MQVLVFFLEQPAGACELCLFIKKRKIGHLKRKLAENQNNTTQHAGFVTAHHISRRLFHPSGKIRHPTTYNETNAMQHAGPKTAS
jgi:hypothetical protein